ncbi:hypothetical protein SVIO_021610 [Streptomyces violaceusniger]|uniref:Uncharacterized protein n=1 Tax=Streptomyces violaceusniger TaxID=68280 RepID=A0A4D4KYX3_STRVO|nr:hypothetical protein SVIO_021610 [Streptomyces violaceusniger]
MPHTHPLPRYAAPVRFTTLTRHRILSTGFAKWGRLGTVPLRPPTRAAPQARRRALCPTPFENHTSPRRFPVHRKRPDLPVPEPAFRQHLLGGITYATGVAK